jgi:ribosomal protein L40E
MLVQYCPKCNAQLPPGLEKCPVCGHRLDSKSNEDVGAKDIIWLSLTILGYVLVPLLIIIGIVFLIIWLL